jgi:hypothetical protein
LRLCDDGDNGGMDDDTLHGGNDDDSGGDSGDIVPKRLAKIRL